ncbi:MAG: hypothetical protein PHF63_06830 [Herbinix sp.]|nr:hypothetical protein [Herbinix sp.]
MNMNAVADQILEFLNTKHLRVYRNKAPKEVDFPYMVYKVESVMNTMPSEDLYLYIDIYEDINKSVRVMEDLADSIDNELNQKIINTDTLNLYFDREARQYINSEELVGTHLINLRYVIRAYFK